MRSYRFDRWQFVLLLGAVALMLLLASSLGATRAHAQEPAGLGAPIIIVGCMDVTLVVQASDADYTSIFWRDSYGTLGVTSKQAGAPINLNAVPAGELILGIVVNETGNTYQTGSGVNPDGIPHATYDGTTVGFEDIYGGGDFDYNDAVLSISMTPCAEPEIAVLTLSVDPAGTGHGIVTGEGIYALNTMAHPMASAAGGSYLVTWGGACAGNAATTDVLMNANKHCTARFDSVVTPTPPPTPVPTVEPTATPTPEVEGAEVGIDNTRVSPSPAQVGDGVTFRIDVTLAEVPDTNEAEVLVEFDSSYLAYASTSVAQCQLLDIGIACDFGQISSDFSFDVSFMALAVTNSTATDATLGSDFDGPGAGGSTVAGPASADVAIVDVAGVQLPPLGDGSSSAAGTSGGALPMTTGIVLLGAMLGLAIGTRRRNVIGR